MIVSRKISREALIPFPYNREGNTYFLYEYVLMVSDNYCENS